jgi:hypothetical protein
MSSNSRRWWLALPLVFGLNAIDARQVYKWIDDYGTVHYSEQPPPDGIRATVVHIDMKPTSGGDNFKESSDFPSKDGAGIVEKIDVAQQHHLCDAARSNLNMLNNQAIVIDGGDITSAKQLNDDQKMELRNELQAQIAKYCGTQ